MKKKAYTPRYLPARVAAYLDEHIERVVWNSDEKIGRDRFFDLLSDVEGLLTGGTPINDELIKHAPKLRIVSNMAVGYNNFDIDAMRRAGIIGTHTPGVLDDTVADLIVGLMLATARRLPELDQLIRQGQWVKGLNEELYGLDLHHATVGIIGMGRIGEAVAKRARLGFDMDVLYYNRSRNEAAEQQYDATYCTMEQLLGQADFVVVMTPLTPETEKLIGKDEFALMKSSAIFINASRGQVVDEQALVRALRSGTIRAAGLDVFETEPLPSDHPFTKMPNVVLAPHIGSATSKTRDDMAMLAAQNLVAGLNGEVPPNVVRELR